MAGSTFFTVVSLAPNLRPLTSLFQHMKASPKTFNGDKDAFLEAGYACVGQSTRGHAESEGEEGIGVRFFVDPEDGYERPHMDHQTALV